MVHSSASAPFILDCDTGRDDALAIWYALRDNMPLCGVVASYGNTPLDNVMVNCRRVLAAFPECAIPVFRGADRPLQTHCYFDDVVLPRQDASGDGLCNVKLPFDPQIISCHAQENLPDNVDAIIAFIKAQHIKQGRKLTYVITGPATSFVHICAALGSAIHDYIDRVVMMGGKFDTLWDQMPYADFNIGADPYAVDFLLRCGLRVDFIAMNMTWPIVITLEDILVLKAQTPLARYAQDIMVAHCREFSPEPVFRFHDPAVMAALKNDAIFVPCKLTVDLDEAGGAFGRLVDAPDLEKENAALWGLDPVESGAIKKALLTTIGLTES
tara:strand:- start:144604 stop:145584 length:981 start_codon:yes stop_codon:yes gene_type:complete